MQVRRTPHHLGAQLSGAIVVVALLGVCEPSPAAAATVKVARSAMGSQFYVTAIHEDEAVAQSAAEAAYAEIERIEAMISSWRETSQTSAVNRAAGQGPIAVSPELFGLVRRSLEVSKLTGGAFDITFAGAGTLWTFEAGSGTQVAVLPDPEKLRQALLAVDYRAVRLDAAQHTVELMRPGMRMGFGAIGKGYAANRAVHVMKDLGLTSGMVNAGGDLVAFGSQEDGSPWSIGIADPLVPDRVFGRLDLVDQAVVTSGDYERFVEIDGERYAHILDPRTGWPVQGVRSVTVVCPDGELADALATSVFVLGIKDGLALVDRLRGVEALAVDDAGKIHLSAHLQGLRVEPTNKYE